jgi:hypothetical protein
MLGVKKLVLKADWNEIGENMARLSKQGYTRFEVVLPGSEKHRSYGLAEEFVLLKAWRKGKGVEG